jgi:2-phosphosulfolactate phosphatase
MYFDQSAYAVRCEWGLAGLAACLPGSAALVIVDTLSFSTAVDIAVSRGARVFPFAARDETAQAFAAERGALLASRDRHAGFSLSPASLLRLPAGAALVLPSPNGATLSLQTGTVPTYAACLRNAPAVARAAARHGGPVTIIAAGERWPDGSLRSALEDWLGAGSVVQHLPGPWSPEAKAAAAAFDACRPQIGPLLAACSSGRELIDRGSAADVELAAECDVSAAVPLLVDGAYTYAPGAAPAQPKGQAQR